MTNHSSRFRLYVAAVSVAAATVVAVSWSVSPPRGGWILLLLVLAAITAENISVELPSGGSASIAYPVSFAALLLFGVSAGSLTAALTGLSFNDLRQKKPPLIVLFNISQLTLSSGLAGLLYLQGLHLLPHRLSPGLLQQPLSASDFPAVVPLLVAVAVLSVFLNNTLVGLGISLYKGLPFRTIWLENVAWAIPTHLALAALGTALAQIVATVGPIGLALFVVPLLVSSQIYQRYVFLRSAYADTVRALVAAIEAKDRYTHGHSERVSEYATAIARAMDLPPAVVERIEIAALLHDLGKLGISKRILLKDRRLNVYEMKKVKEHPQIGAHIVEHVSFLSPMVPSILYHHERVDGTGYGSGLVGSEIPLEARILAVADSYDAMTSDRPYRPALASTVALEEIRAMSGSQFDEDVARVFCALMINPGEPTSALDQVPQAGLADEA